MYNSIQSNCDWFSIKEERISLQIFTQIDQNSNIVYFHFYVILMVALHAQSTYSISRQHRMFWIGLRIIKYVILLYLSFCLNLYFCRQLMNFDFTLVTDYHHNTIHQLWKNLHLIFMWHFFFERTQIEFVVLLYGRPCWACVKTLFWKPSWTHFSLKYGVILLRLQ